MYDTDKETSPTDYFEHHGTKGMRWGVRREARLTINKRVGAGKGSLLDKAVVANQSSVVGLVRNKGLKGNARALAAAQEQRKARIASGHTTVKDLINHFGNELLTQANGPKG